MDASEKILRKILKKSAVFVRSSGHDIYRLENGHSVSIRRPSRRGHQDHWKSALSYVKRTLRLPNTLQIKEAG